MLGKLLKHEMKACARLLFPIYLVLIVLTVMERIVLSLDVFNGVLQIIPGFLTFAYIISILAIVVLSFVIIIFRFYKNLITDEGYLMFTLPAKSHQLINSKLIVSLLWTFICIIAIFASLVAVFYTPDRFHVFMNGLKTFVTEFNAEIGDESILFLIEIILLIILSLIRGIIQIYASIALGQLLGGHKIIGSFAAYIGLYTFTQILLIIVLFIGGSISNKSIEDIAILPQMIFPVTLILTIVFNAAFYFLTNYIFQKKLNLE
ncbi:MAG: hypothetical protein PHF63_08330 [Herbinix sp.]|nr:hypothetical protein [Herbinix sp.]